MNTKSDKQKKEDVLYKVLGGDGPDQGEEGEVNCDMVTPDPGGHVHIHVQEVYKESGGLSLDHPVLVMLTILITIVLAIIIFRVYRKRIGEKKQ